MFVITYTNKTNYGNSQVKFKGINYECSKTECTGLVNDEGPKLHLSALYIVSCINNNF